MVAYADTSFLFSLYAQDANTGRAARTAAANHALWSSPRCKPLSCATPFGSLSFEAIFPNRSNGD